MGVPVIAVSGPPGAGKTTLVAALARRLAPVAILEFDRYELATFLSPDLIVDWLDRGADYDSLPLGPLAEDLGRLKRGEAVTRAGGPKVAAAPLVLFDTLLGKSHAPTASMIDRLVWLDTPLDVALARKVGALVKAARNGPAGGGPSDMLGWLDHYLTQYLRFIRRTYIVQRERVRPGADLILDGFDDAETAADRVVRAVLPGLV